MFLYTVAVVCVTILVIIGTLSAIRAFSVMESDVEWIDALGLLAWRLCARLCIAQPEHDPEIDPTMDRYHEFEPNPYLQYITKIVVPDQHALEQVTKAIRYIHDFPTLDTDYMAVNYIAHLYCDECGEPTDTPYKIVIE